MQPNKNNPARKLRTLATMYLNIADCASRQAETVCRTMFAGNISPSGRAEYELALWQAAQCERKAAEYFDQAQEIETQRPAAQLLELFPLPQPQSHDTQRDTLTLVPSKAASWPPRPRGTS